MEHTISQAPADAAHGRGHTCQTWRPQDQPAFLWCTNCDSAASATPEDIADSDIRLRYHLSCRVAGALVWVWGAPTRARSLTAPRAMPHCGDVNCVGLCTDPACYPEEKEQRTELVQTDALREQLATARAGRNVAFVSATLLALLLLYFKVISG